MPARRLLALVVCVTAAVPAHAAQFSEPIANFESMPVKTLGAKPSSAQVREAIVRAGERNRRRNWAFTEPGPGQLIATVSVRAHLAEVNIVYSADSYSLTYRHSANLNYRRDGPTIHPNYNAWVTELVENINVELSRVVGVGGTPVASPSPPASAVRFTPVGGSANAAEVSFWESVRDSRDPAELQAYLDAYPQGVFAPLARSRLAAMKTK